MKKLISGILIFAVVAVIFSSCDDRGSTPQLPKRTMVKNPNWTDVLTEIKYQTLAQKRVMDELKKK